MFFCLFKQGVFGHAPGQGTGTQHVTLTVVEFRHEDLHLALHISENMLLKRFSQRFIEPLACMRDATRKDDGLWIDD